jgi:hypothetical protein
MPARLAAPGSLPTAPRSEDEDGREPNEYDKVIAAHGNPVPFSWIGQQK